MTERVRLAVERSDNGNEMKKPHVAMISANLPPTACGIGDYTACLAPALVDLGIQVTLVSRKQNASSRINGVPVREAVNQWTASQIPVLDRVLQDLNPDIIHVQYEPFAFRQSYVLPMYLGMKKPLVATVHEVWQKHALQRWRDRRFYSACDQIIVNDEGRRQSLLGMTPLPGRVTKLGVGPNFKITADDVVDIRALQKNDALRLCYFGFFNRVKRVDLLLEAIHILAEKNDLAVELNCIGPFAPEEEKDHRALRDQVSRLGLEDKIKFLGHLDQTEIIRVLKSSDVAVLPYLDGATPRRGSFQLCAALGLPIVTAAASPPEPQIVNGETALLLEKITASGLASALFQIFSSSTTRERLSQGAQRFSTHFTWPKIAEQHLPIYERVLKSLRSSRGLSTAQGVG